MKAIEERLQEALQQDLSLTEHRFCRGNMEMVISILRI